MIEVLRVSGLLALPQGPLRWTLSWSLPVLVAAFLWLPLASPSWRTILWNGMAFPFAEEWLYRGMAIGALMRWARWRWWTAALLPAFALGMAHLGMGQHWLDSASIVALTAAGGLLFGWLFQGWVGNLWPAVFLRAALNSLWQLFDLGHDALGGRECNVLRAFKVVMALGLVRWMVPATPMVSDNPPQ